MFMKISAEEKALLLMLFGIFNPWRKGISLEKNCRIPVYTNILEIFSQNCDEYEFTKAEFVRLLELVEMGIQTLTGDVVDQLKEFSSRMDVTWKECA